MAALLAAPQTHEENCSAEQDSDCSHTASARSPVSTPGSSSATPGPDPTLPRPTGYFWGSWRGEPGLFTLLDTSPATADPPLSLALLF